MKISCRFEISFRSKWPIWNPYHFEFHFASIHVNTSKELTEHPSEIFNRNETSYRFGFISPLMWTYSYTLKQYFTWLVLAKKNNSARLMGLRLEYIHSWNHDSIYSCLTLWKLMRILGSVLQIISAIATWYKQLYQKDFEAYNSFRIFSQAHWCCTGQQASGEEHLIFLLTTSTCLPKTYHPTYYCRTLTSNRVVLVSDLAILTTELCTTGQILTVKETFEIRYQNITFSRPVVEILIKILVKSFWRTTSKSTDWFLWRQHWHLMR